MNIPVIYEDKWLLIADKPAGLLVIPTPKKETRTLTSILNEDLKRRGIPYRLHPCHRLDRQTSGLIIYAKGKSAQKAVMDAFRERKIKKTYLVFVLGQPKLLYGEIKIPIEGNPALTGYKVVEKRKDFAILEVNPVTGRTNQIRIHLKKIGHPVLGETKYAFRRDFKIKAARLCLHALRLDFSHPLTKEHLHLEAKLPYYLSLFLEKND